MVRRTKEPQTRRHIWIADADWDFLVRHFGENPGPSAAVRTIIRAFIKQTELKAEQAGRPVTEQVEDVTNDL